MKILIGFEESQEVCLAFRKFGFDAYSCDLKPCSGSAPEYHLQMDIYEAIKLNNWDFIGIHPVCTKITLSRNRHYAPGKPKHNERVEAVEWTIKLWEYVIGVCDHVYMENPMGAMNGDPRLPKPQIIQPYYFGDEAQKTTCLWLHGLPFLQHFKETDLFSIKTHVPMGEMVTFKSGKVMPKWLADTPSGRSEKNRTIRSKTFHGIAEAMARQWVDYLSKINTNN